MTLSRDCGATTTTCLFEDTIGGDGVRGVCPCPTTALCPDGDVVTCEPGEAGSESPEACAAEKCLIEEPMITIICGEFGGETTTCIPGAGCIPYGS